MPPVRTAKATWTGSLKDGKGHMRAESGKVDATFSFNTRMGDEVGTNPRRALDRRRNGQRRIPLEQDSGGVGASSRPSLERVIPVIRNVPGS